MKRNREMDGLKKGWKEVRRMKEKLESKIEVRVEDGRRKEGR